MIPTFIGWRKSKSQGSKLDYYHQKINILHDDGRLDEKDVNFLDSLRKTITNEYTKGKINKEQYDKLIDEISVNYNKIFRKKINFLFSSSAYNKENKIIDIESDIDDAYAGGKINELHYNLLQKELSKYVK